MGLSTNRGVTDHFSTSKKRARKKESDPAAVRSARPNPRRGKLPPN